MALSPNYSRRRIYWLSQETTSDGLPTSENTAGSLDLATDGILQCALPSRGETLVFSTTDLWVVSYIGGTLVYSARQAGNNCGVVSPRAAVVLD